MDITRRGFFGLTAAGGLLAQDRAPLPREVDMVVLRFQVTDNQGRYVGRHHALLEST